MRGKILKSGILFFFFCFMAHSAIAADDWLQGANGYDHALEESQASGKPMVVYFYTDWCPFCRKFEKNVLTNDKVKKELNAFILVRINPEKGPQEDRLASEYHVDGYPTVYFRGQKVKDVSRLTRSADDFARAAAEFSKTAGSKQNAGKTVLEESSAPAQNVSAESPDTVLYLNTGREVQGVFVSEDAKGLTLAIQDLGNVYFSNSEFSKSEKIKK